MDSVATMTTFRLLCCLGSFLFGCFCFGGLFRRGGFLFYRFSSGRKEQVNAAAKRGREKKGSSWFFLSS